MAKAKRRFTFKKQPKITGLAGVGHPNQHVDIKQAGLIVGQITAPSYRRSTWGVGLMINKPASENCGWSWWFPREFATEEQARDWLNSPEFKAPDCGLRAEEPDEE